VNEQSQQAFEGQLKIPQQKSPLDHTQGNSLLSDRSKEQFQTEGAGSIDIQPTLVAPNFQEIQFQNQKALRNRFSNREVSFGHAFGDNTKPLVKE